MRNWSILTKISVAANGVILLLLVLGGFALIKFEINLVNMFSAEFLTKISQTIDERQQAEAESLRQNVTFTTQILSEISAKHLYDIDPDAIAQPLRSYLNYPEIQAIQVLDDHGQPFAAIWRTPEISLSTTLPGELVLDHKLLVQAAAVYKQKKMGSVTVYYSDAGLAEKISRAQENAVTVAAELEKGFRARLNRAIRYQSLGTLLIIVALGSCLTLLLRTFVLRPLHTIAHTALTFADFDLTVTLPSTSHDEIGRLFQAIQKMAQSFNSVLRQVQRSGNQVTSSSAELSATTIQQEATMSTQMESTQRVVKEVQDISQVAVELADAMRHVAALLEETVGFASSGQTDLTSMQDAMQHMEQASVAISGRLQAINEKADKITTVVTTITKVADQTNLLSLNAAIEAEKAGEYGRGFTVVASEIRRLADQTAVATLDIEQMVHEMQSAVSSGVTEIDKFIAEVRRSVENVDRISLQLTKIIEQVQALSPRFDAINLAMDHQSEHVQHINTAILYLSGEMQQTRVSLHETFAAIRQLNEAARDLQQQVSRFKVN